ncbi:LysR family transcriptional regulator [Thalassovita mediterranea]|jgi:DNA-binding transcriptional LysR family regulator|uniref:Hca operon transcriptional activator n=1 Tax=Thalassovita mediterranea TaxID=340021 RepID=A0A0P1GNZ9_9RHOB|nr:LysR family transcriptional regulator [Thalassovita mediterranea]MCG7573264.1 LysR family transcriptional regulator [Phaeobacter sp. CNT1-3]CUH84202.1 Hca operon transcriptional activator [Thalassovita mediterranea]SIS27577.1 transcriptional regulator, LysR family [Thalassovita mediterranea]
MANTPNRIRRLKHIEAFSAVISNGSISGAARQLGVSQPAVSQLIKSLEDAIGAPLFIRRNGAIFPTSRAESLREDAIELLAHLDRFQAQLSHQKTGHLSTIRISASMSVTSELLPSVLSELSGHSPDIKYYVSSVPLGTMVPSLVQGHIDFAIHTRKLEHPTLYNDMLFEAQQVAVMSASHPLAQKDDLCIADFKGCRIITSTKSDPSYHYFERLWREENLPTQTVLQSPFASFAIQMVEPMRAVTFNNEVMARVVVDRTPGLVIRKVEGLKQMTPFFLACAEWQYGSETHHLLRDSFLKAVQP